MSTIVEVMGRVPNLDVIVMVTSDALDVGLPTAPSRCVDLDCPVFPGWPLPLVFDTTAVEVTNWVPFLIVVLLVTTNVLDVELPPLEVVRRPVLV